MGYMRGVEGRFEGSLGAFRLDAEFRLAPEGITALSGPSGAGKTTLLRCIAGLTRLPGRLVVDGEVWQDEKSFLAPHRRPVGVVFQEAALLSHLSVKGNLLFGAKRSRRAFAHLPPSLREPPPERVDDEGGFDDIVELLGLAPLLARGTASLSGGERQRVALGRALLTRPKLVLLDEPLSSLDAGAKAEILPYLERLHRTLKVPALYISHDAGEIGRLADHLLLIRDGRVSPGGPVRRPVQELAALSPAERDALALAALKAGLAPEVWPWSGAPARNATGR
jgi:molybdate transport system ATP-binding protein